MTTDDVLEHLAGTFFEATRQQRNDYANTALAWAEGEGADLFGRLRHAIFQVEFAINAKEALRVGLGSWAEVR